MAEENVVYTGDCHKYRVPARCYRANDWASGGALIEATVEVYFVTEPKPNMLVRVRDKKSAAVWSCDAYDDTVFRSEDSDRYFVLRIGGSNTSSTESADYDEDGYKETIGIGFSSSQESAKFTEALEPAVPEIQVYRAPQGSSSAAASPVCVTPVKESNYCPRAASPTLAVRTQEPEISFDETSVHATRASVQAINNSTNGSDSNEGNSKHDKEQEKKGSNVDKVDNNGGNANASNDESKEKEEKDGKDDGDVIEVIEDLDSDESTQTEHAKEDKEAADTNTNTDENENENGSDSKEGKDKEEEHIVGTRRHHNEDISQEVWRRHRKHVFVVSIAGKPIYSRFGDEQLLAPFMASLMALVSFVEDCQDSIRYFVAGEWQVVFHVRGPVIAVCVCSTSERRSDLERALFYVHSQLAAVLTFGTITKIFSRRPDFDLRGLLSAGDITLLDNVVHRVNREPSIMLDAVEPLRMPRDLRAAVEAAVAAAACPELLFAFAVSGFSLIHMARPRRFSLRAADVHLIMNFVASSDAFRSSCVWTPLCLPLFDNKGFLHAHIGYIADNVALVLISSHVDAFYKMNECATLITKALTDDGSLPHLAALCARKMKAAAKTMPKEGGTATGTTTTTTTARYPVTALRIPHLRHFVYKSLALVQITTPDPGLPDGPSRERTKALFRLYQWARSQVTKPASGALAPAALPPHKLYYRISSNETVMALFTKSYEIYAAFGPIVRKQQALAACNAISTYVTEHEDELFVRPSTW